MNFNTIIQSDIPVLADFSAEWCGPCKAMAPILKQVKNQMEEALRIIKIDVDKNPKAAKQFQIQSVPTLILFHKGKVIWQSSGVIPASQLLQIIRTNIPAFQN